MPNVELSAFIENELASNPLLEASEDREGRASEPPESEPQTANAEVSIEPGDWASEMLETDPATLASNLDTEVDNAFELDRPAIPTPGDRPSQWSSASGGHSELTEPPNLDAYLAESISLRDHLERQAGVLIADPAERMIALALVDGLDETGYFLGSQTEIAQRLGIPIDVVAETLVRMQSLEPTGVFARDLAECLALQLRERDRFDPAMQALIENLPALARRDYAFLRRACGVDDEDLLDMIDEIKRLEPKPGRPFGDPPAPPAIPDVYVTAGPDRTWRVELNSKALPRVLVNDVYAAEVRLGARRDEDKQYISAQLQSANWLTKSLEQRARTILNVATEIVRRQDAFLVEGVRGLRPLNLKMVGEAIGVHESTVSRATAHKFIQTPRGLFEMKYFFTAAIASGSGQAHSAEAVRQRIRRMIEEEDPSEVLSDDVIVERLRKDDIVVARRTVAKYRDSLRIPSSVERRKLKMALVPSPRMRDESVSIQA
jgi:RNA polymerase sigma-54 factor